MSLACRLGIRSMSSIPSNLNGYLAQKKTLWMEEARHAESRDMAARAIVKGRSGIREIRIRDVHQIIADSPPGMAGYDLGASAHVAHVYLITAAVLDVPLDNLEVEARGSVDTRPIHPGSELPPSKMENIGYTVHVTSNADEAKIKALHEHVERVCPVLNTLTNSCKVETQLVLTKSEEA